MARRTPNLQTRSQYGSYWGVYATALVLPNTAGAPVAAPKFDLEEGDIAYVQGVGMYQCTSQGGAGAAPPAVWAQIGFASVMQDRFAPTFLVGNTAEGDSNVAYNSGGFNYYPDIGDGAQLAVALGAVTKQGGVVYVRRGTYDLNLAGSPATPLAVKDNTIVQGEGINATRIQGRPTANQGIFAVNADSVSIRDLRLTISASDAGSLGSVAVVDVTGTSFEMTRVAVEFTTVAAGALKDGVRLTGPSGSEFSLTDVVIETAGNTGALSPTICLETINPGARVEARNLRVNGGDVGVRSNTAFVASDLNVQNFFVVGVAGVGPSPTRLANARIETSVGALPGVLGVSLQGNSNELSGVSISTSGISSATGLRVSNNGGSSDDSTFRAVTISGFDTGIDLGVLADASFVRRTLIDNCIVTASRLGILVATQSETVKISDCYVRAAVITTGITVAGIDIESGTLDVQVNGNTVDITDTFTNLAVGIRHAGRGSVNNNRVVFTGCAWGIEVDGQGIDCSHNQVTGTNVDSAQGAIHLANVANNANARLIGNLADFQQTAYTNPAMLIDGNRAQVSLNTTVVTAAGPASAGISLSATSLNCNCIGNICQGSGAVVGIVQNVGTGNNLSNNIGT
jgi:hypothetical protein